MTTGGGAVCAWSWARGLAGSMTTREATARSGADSAAGKTELSPTPSVYFAAEAIGAATSSAPESTARLRTRARRRAGERIGEGGPSRLGRGATSSVGVRAPVLEWNAPDGRR